jgi:hypothetical protein
MNLESLRAPMILMIRRSIGLISLPRSGRQSPKVKAHFGTWLRAGGLRLGPRGHRVRWFGVWSSRAV